MVNTNNYFDEVIPVPVEKNYYIEASFIREYLDRFYTKKTLKTLDDEEVYTISLYRPLKSNSYGAMCDFYFNIEELDDPKMIHYLQFNNSSAFALTLCKYDESWVKIKTKLIIVEK